MRRLSREFVAVAEEVHFLYPEGAWALERRKNDPAHLLFKRFGTSMPPEDWNHPGTKQGVYMMGPQGEYLEGGGAISGDAAKVKERLQRALERWNQLRRAKGYANRPVPSANRRAPSGIDGAPLILRAYLRDLPRGTGDSSGRRFKKADLRGLWRDFVKWAWNVNWITFDGPSAFVTRSSKPRAVDRDTVLRLCREVLVDNVRGQTGRWRRDDVKEATLTVRRTAIKQHQWHLEYRGQATMRSDRQSFTPTLYGRAVWDPKRQRLRSFELVAIGTRTGAGSFNQRSRDPGPAPMGVAIVLHR